MPKRNIKIAIEDRCVQDSADCVGLFRMTAAHQFLTYKQSYW